MVQLHLVKELNALLKTNLPSGLVAVFTGATSGIGEAALKKFVQNTTKPRCYITARSQSSADRVVAECKRLNPQADVRVVLSDLSLIKNVDKVCEQIESKEEKINLLFLSAGAALLDRKQTSEGIHGIAAISVYSRVRFIQQLLPLLRRSQHLSRVVNIAGGGAEGKLHTEDWQALTIPFSSFKGHLSAMISLAHEQFSSQAPNVSFLHVYPGTVNTNLFVNMTGFRGFMARIILNLLAYWVAVPIDESGERNLFASTAGMYPPHEEGANGLPLPDGLNVARGTDGVKGSGAYSLNWNGESSSEDVEKLLQNYKKQGTQEELWQHFQAEFKRITGKP